MPTRNRHGFIPKAFQYFSAQDYPNKQLVVIDDSDHAIREDLPEGCLYEYSFRRRTVGLKRNLCCSMAEGEIIVHWDDDDYSAPGRISDQVRRLQSTGAKLTGYHEMMFEELGSNRYWLYSGRPGYALGTSLCYWRSYWEERPFLDLQCGEDNQFQAGASVLTVPAGKLMLARIHTGGTMKRDMRSLGRHREWTSILREEWENDSA